MVNALDNWWAGLRVSWKERIATKILQKNPDLKGEPTYPGCTALWNSLPEEKKEWVYNHCKHGHGYHETIEFDGDPLTD